MRVSGWLYLIQQGFGTMCLLSALGINVGLPKRCSWRLAAVSLLGGLGCLCAALIPYPWLRAVLLLLFALFAPHAVWHGLPRSLRLPLSLTSCMLSLVMAGWGRLLSGFHLARLFLFLSVCLSLPLVSRLLIHRPAPRCATVEIIHGERCLRLTALVDSGNLLRDPITGLPVIVVSRKAASRLITLPPPGEIIPGMRLISIRTVAGTSLMAVFRPRRVCLHLPDGWQTVDAMIGLSPAGYDGFQALVPSGLIMPVSSPNILSQGGTLP